MLLKVNYHGNFKKKLSISEDFVHINAVKNVAVFNVLSVLIRKYSKLKVEDFMIGKNVLIKVNGNPCNSLAQLLRDGDIIDLITMEKDWYV